MVYSQARRCAGFCPTELSRFKKLFRNHDKEPERGLFIWNVTRTDSRAIFETTFSLISQHFGLMAQSTNSSNGFSEGGRPPLDDDSDPLGDVCREARQDRSQDAP